MRTMLKETESPGKKVKNIILSKPDENKKRLSKIPTSRSKLAPKISEGAFSNIMTVRSSLEEAGRHQVTHQVKNLKTGGSNTMLNKLVNGQKINLTFKAVS
ncbi:uncharacterized protein LOC132721670 [Ruditapes philippinarum]|uniref:uncharacterized protein LOC132721670 n=1 Tax=Ruditapes philippinarum TaxID=129788 RepID=UPI00295A87ED|nr:uncharacterized protein LOC132721670 [Ruditapes philippinarum]